MTIDFVEAIGLCAGFCSTFATSPQIIKVWRYKSAEDLSINMLFLMWTGNFLWLVYALLISSLSLILANAVSLVFVSSLIYLKIKYTE